jgi:hypothetical protein
MVSWREEEKLSKSQRSMMKQIRWKTLFLAALSNHAENVLKFMNASLA